MIDMIKETIDLNRGANALYDCVDAVFLTVIATIGGSRALSNVTTVWADGVLSRGWPVGFTSLTTAHSAACFALLENVK